MVTSNLGTLYSTFNINIEALSPESNGNSFQLVGQPLPGVNIQNSSFFHDVWGNQVLPNGARAYVRYANGQNGPLTKPLIIAEGIDPNDYFGPDRLSIFLNQTVDFNSINQEFYEHCADLGYDIIIVDFVGNGAADLHTNTKSLKAVIDTANGRKVGGIATGEQLVVGGISMGGIIARMALRKMELDCENHHTKLFVTYDSPHNGAEAPLGIQWFIRDLIFRGAYFIPELRELYDYGKSDATRQLLNSHYQSGNNPDPMRVALANYLGDIGYPEKCKKIAMSLGNPTTNKIIPQTSAPGYVDYHQGDKVFYGKFVAGGFFHPFRSTMELGLYSTKRLSSSVVSDLDLKVRALYFPIILNKEREAQTVRYPEVSSGGYLSTFEQVKSSFEEFSLDFDNESNEVEYPNGKAAWSSFVPFYSAVGAVTVPFAEKKYANQSLSDFIRDFETPFDQLYCADLTQQFDHAEAFINQSLAVSLLSELAQAANSGVRVPIESLSVAYNYGFSELKLNPVSIESQGVLKVNHNGATEFGSGPVASNNHLVASIESDACGTDLIIKNSGILTVGDPSGNRTAELTTKSLQVVVESGGILRINDNSRLILDEESRLVINENVTIELLGPNAVLEIKGKMELMPNVDFDFNGLGRIVFNGTENYDGTYDGSRSIVFGAGSGVNLLGTSANPKIIEIQQDQLYIPDNGYFRLRKARVEMGTNSALWVVADAHLLLSTFTSNTGAFNGHRGLAVYGQSTTITNCKFEYGDIGINALLIYRGTPLALRNCTFKNNSRAVLQQGAGLFLTNCTFEDNSTRHVQSDGSYFPVTVSNSTFTGGEDGVIIANQAASPFHSYDSDYTDLDIGIGITGGPNNSLSCNTFTGNTFGVHVDAGNLLMNTIYGMGNNEFRHSSNFDVGIGLNHATDIDLDQGFNDIFGNINVTAISSPVLAIDGTVRFNGTLNYNANSNRWPSTHFNNNLPQHGNNYFLTAHVTSTSNSVGNVILNDASPVTSTNSCFNLPICHTSGFPDVDPTQRNTGVYHGADCTTDPIQTCNDCSLVLVDGTFVGVNQGLLLKLEDLSKAKDMADSLDVLHGIQDIFSQPLDSISPEEAYIVRKAFAIGFGLYGKYIEAGLMVGNSQGIINETILQMSSLDDFRLINTFAGYDVIPGFQLEVSQAQLIQFSTGTSYNRSASVSYLNTVRSNFQGIDQKIIDYWICTYQSHHDAIASGDYNPAQITDCRSFLSSGSQRNAEYVEQANEVRFDDEFQVKIYPNPVINLLSIDVNQPNLNYVIQSTAGEVIKRGQLTTKLNAIDLSNIPGGIYVLKVFNEEYVEVQKFVLGK